MEWSRGLGSPKIPQKVPNTRWRCLQVITHTDRAKERRGQGGTQRRIVHSSPPTRESGRWRGMIQGTPQIVDCVVRMCEWDLPAPRPSPTPPRVVHAHRAMRCPVGFFLFCWYFPNGQRMSGPMCAARNQPHNQPKMGDRVDHPTIRSARPVPGSHPFMNSGIRWPPHFLSSIPSINQKIPPG